MITITSNMADVESDADCMSPAPTGKPNGINPTTLGVVSGSSVGMCYLSPFSMCTRGDRAPSESNLSSSGYSSMASPGPSRCGSSNPLCPSEMEDPGSGEATRSTPVLLYCTVLFHSRRSESCSNTLFLYIRFLPSQTHKPQLINRVHTTIMHHHYQRAIIHRHQHHQKVPPERAFRGWAP